MWKTDTQSLLKANGILLPQLELYGHINLSDMSLHLREPKGLPRGLPFIFKML